MLEFQNPAAFLLLLLVPLLFLLRYLKIFRKLTFMAVLSDWNGKAFTWNGKVRKFLSWLAKLILFTGFLTAVTALADPVITHQEKVYTSLGTDIVFVVDTSPSMAAKDMGDISRLDSAKLAIHSVVKEYDGCRFGMVVLGSEASVLIPPTSDLPSFTGRIDGIVVGMLGTS